LNNAGMSSGLTAGVSFVVVGFFDIAANSI
jgi:hypothetical protein